MNDCFAVGIWYFQGLLTPGIACVVAYIAWQQWRTNARRVKLDLFDRRFRVFDATRKLLGLWYTVGIKDEDYLKFLQETAEARFLFGAEIEEYRDDIYQRVQRWMFASQELRRAIERGASVEERTRLSETEQSEIKWAMNEVKVLADRFKKYIDLSKL